MLLIKILVLVFGCIQTKGNNVIQDRIIGGRPQDISQAAHMLQLLDNNRFICGSSLIKPKVALTAAHCTNSPNTLSVRGGSSTLYGGKVVKVAKAIRYSGYNPRTQDGDIAMLILSEIMNATLSKPIGIYNSNVAIPVNALVQVSGWGITNTQLIGQPSYQLQEIDLNVVSPTDCIKKYRGYINITTNMICAAAQGKDSCSGDSGGALLYNGKIAGVVSFGIGCANSNFPGVYTNVYRYLQFISATLRSNGYVL